MIFKKALLPSPLLLNVKFPYFVTILLLIVYLYYFINKFLYFNLYNNLQFRLTLKRYPSMENFENINVFLSDLKEKNDENSRKLVDFYKKHFNV